MVRSLRERGMSLIEVLVATAILSVVVLVALMLYDASRKAFAKSENATEQQEAVRIAFDRITTELRMLGYNVNPDGNPSRPDEQLEGALERAVIFRADFDRSDPTASITPEAALAGGAFSTVSTGNDEIVAYVLANPDGTGPDSITFQADVRETPRDGMVEPVTIDNVVLSPTSPPYTLYRVTLNNDARTYGSRGFIVRTPVVENVRDLRFTYYGTGGTFTDPSSTIAETAIALAARSSLIRIGVSLVGMTKQPDPAFNDPSDPPASHYRKFELKGDVTPRNVGLRGSQDLNADVTPPTRPATPTLVAGHCGGLLAIWVPNAAAEGVTNYLVNWSGVRSGLRAVPGPPYFLDGLTEGETYSVFVEAQDAQGNVSSPSGAVSAAVTNVNTPSVPTGFSTSIDQTYQIAVGFAAVGANVTNDPQADPQAPRIRDLAGYRLYWSASPTFPADRASWSRVADEHVLGPSFVSPYLDTPVTACVDRYYRMTAVDTCGVESDATNVSHGRAVNSGMLPAAPGDTQAQYERIPDVAHVRWSPVTQDANSKDIVIDHYSVFRSDPTDGTQITWGSAPLAVVPTTDYVDQAVPTAPAGQVFYYRIQASDSCGNDSAYSTGARLECTFVGDVAIPTPANKGQVSGAIYPTAAVANGNGDYAQVTFIYKQVGSSTVLAQNVVRSPGPSWADTVGWTAPQTGKYTITATVSTSSGCTQTSSVLIYATSQGVP